MFGFVKLLTKSGRQALVKEIATEYLTPEKIAELAADGVAKLLEKGAEKMSDERCAQVALGCEKACAALTHITAAIEPTGDEGKKVSETEKTLIAADIRVAIELLVTDDGLTKAIDAGAKYIP